MPLHSLGLALLDELRGQGSTAHGRIGRIDVRLCREATACEPAQVIPLSCEWIQLHEPQLVFARCCVAHNFAFCHVQF